MAQFQRGENPPFFDEYRKYLPWLRLDFKSRCAYCERTESWLGGQEAFVVDHFRPRRFKELVTTYNNLYYSCRKCNEHKSDTWPSEEDIEKGLRFSDPCAEDMYTTHLRETRNGKLEVLTSCGRYTQEHIRLNRPVLVDWRQARRTVLEDIATLEGALMRLQNLVSDESDDAEKERVLREVIALQHRIQTDRKLFL